ARKVSANMGTANIRTRGLFTSPSSSGRVPGPLDYTAAFSSLSGSKLFLFHIFQLGIGQRPAVEQAEIGDIFERKSWHLRGVLGFHQVEFSPFHVVQHERWPQIFFHGAHLYIGEFDTFDVTDKKSVGRHVAVTVGLGVLFLFFRWIDGSLLFGAAALIVDANIAQLHIFNIVSGNSHDQRAILGIGVVDHDVADVDAVQRADGNTIGRTHAGAQANINRSVGNITHGDVADTNVGEFCAIDRFERQPAGVIKDTVGNRDVPE